MKPSPAGDFKEKFHAAFVCLQEGRAADAQARFADLLSLSPPPSPAGAADEVVPMELLPMVSHHLRRLHSELCSPSFAVVREGAPPWQPHTLSGSPSIPSPSRESSVFNVNVSSECGPRLEYLPSPVCTAAHVCPSSLP